MDIRPPKHPIHSVREFLFELFTVTCGILIALGLEGLIVAHRDAGLADQARAEFRAEIETDQRQVNALMKADPVDEAMILRFIDLGTARLAHRPAAWPTDQTISRTFPTLQNDAWETALATQAIGQLPFAQVRALSTLNDGIVVFNQFETRTRDQWVSIAAFGDPTTLTDDEVRLAMQSLRVAFAYQRAAAFTAHKLLAEMATARAALDAAR